MPQRARTISSRPRRAVLRLEWLEDRRVPSLLGLLSGVVSQVPLLSAAATPALAPAQGTLSGGSSAGVKVDLNAALGVAVGGVKLNLSAGASVNAGGGGLGVNLAVGVSASASPSAPLNLSVGVALGAPSTVALGVALGSPNAAPPETAQPTQAPAPAPVSVEAAAVSPAPTEKVAAAAAPAPLLSGPLQAPAAGPAVKVDGGTAPAAAPGEAPAGPDGAGEPQPVNSPAAPAALGLPSTALLSLGPAVPTGAAAGPFLAPAGNLLPAVAALVTATLSLSPQSTGGAGSPETTAVEAPAPAALLAPPRAPAAPARFESGAVEDEEEADLGPDGCGPATDLTPDALSAEAGAEAATERIVFEAGDGPDYWRLAPWITGLAAALAGAEVLRRRRRAAVLPADAPWSLPGLWPGEDG